MESDRICQIIDTVIDLSAPNKRALLHDLARRAALVLNVDADFLFSALWKREELGSTGVGYGVAIPHARIQGLNKSFGILARLTRAIDFAAIDGRPVDLVFLLLLPANPVGEQLKALASIARKFRDPACLSDLRAARASASLYDAMTS